MTNSEYEIALAEKDRINTSLIDEIKVLKERINELERRLGMNSKNSNKPSSSDGPYKKPQPTSLRIKGQNTSGGQKGHTGHTLVQSENPTIIFRHNTTNCVQCGLSLTDQVPVKIIKRQIFDIPKPSNEITEHQVVVKVCSCGHTNLQQSYIN